jgi:hypothetical protein
MKLTPEIIDAAVIQLRGIFEHADGIPENVKESGNTFLNDLDKWSDQLKKEQAS